MGRKIESDEKRDELLQAAMAETHERPRGAIFIVWDEGEDGPECMYTRVLNTKGETPSYMEAAGALTMTLQNLDGHYED